MVTLTLLENMLLKLFMARMHSYSIGNTKKLFTRKQIFHYASKL